MVVIGPRFHIGPIFFDGLVGYIGSAIAGALAAVLIRWTIRKEWGW
jgi:hypothetical protein